MTFRLSGLNVSVVEPGAAAVVAQVRLIGLAAEEAGVVPLLGRVIQPMPCQRPLMS